MSDDILWRPGADFVEDHPLTAFARRAGETAGRHFDDYRDLHAWSVEDREAFWSAVWDELGIVGDKGARILETGATMRDDRFFPDARLNFAENLLKRTGAEDAVVFRGEGGQSRRMSWDDLHAEVSRWQQALGAAGVGEGDRVVAMLPNLPEAVIVMLAVTAMGGVFSSCSPDFGTKAVLDRFGQVEPKIFVTVDGYFYAGKERETAGTLVEVTKALEPQHAIVVDYMGKAGEVASKLTNGVAASDFLEGVEPREVEFTRLPFDTPAFILYSSGTTGAPKCIVHGGGGTLIQLVKEHRLHCGIAPGARVFYFTTCAWMMWNWLVTSLANEATILLYDGSPFHPDGDVIFRYLADEKATVFGTSAKYIDEVRNRGMTPKDEHDLSSVKLVASTGSPLSDEGFAFVYDAIAPDAQLASIAGGTDIVSCFVLGVPWRPVRAGEIQGPGLGMAVDVWDLQGETVVGEKGELVCTRSFPSMPVRFWGDEDGSRYHGAYFDMFDDVWAHGDFAEWTGTGGIVLHGRSDATLNPQGVRIGTGEIYGILDRIEEIDEAVCIGQSWEGDERVVLFLRLADGVELTDDLVDRVKSDIRDQASPRHVPAVVLAVPDIPRTMSGKITEIGVKRVVEGGEVPNREALENPEALEHFQDREELRA